MKRTAFPALLALALTPVLATAQEVTLRLVSAFPENQFYVKRTVDWIGELPGRCGKTDISKCARRGRSIPTPTDASFPTAMSSARARIAATTGRAATNARTARGCWIRRT